MSFRSPKSKKKIIDTICLKQPPESLYKCRKRSNSLMVTIDFHNNLLAMSNCTKPPDLVCILLNKRKKLI